MPRLRYVSRFEPGFGRRRRGRGFVYVDPRGRPLEDPEALERIKSLAVPPAWEDVWVCAHQRGHLQATGLDAAGRRQYLYHEAWRDERDREKFERTQELGRVLPAVRHVVAGHLRRRGLPRERVLGGAVRMHDRGFFRVGGEEYAEENGSFGVATLLRRHAHVDGPGAVVFDYVAKGGTRRRQRIVDPSLRALVEELKGRRGRGGLLAFRENGRWSDVRSSDVNEYIKEVAEGDFTAKDFRTWHATVLAAVAISVHGEGARSRAARRRAISQAVGEVAGYLGNTPTVCRASYVDPRVFERFEEGTTIRATIDDLAELTRVGGTLQRRVEAAVLELVGDI